ncbi:hypothetical protein HPB47_028503 [Ixodes persulcatus]|uniref:Uncharacterized protein n=1 Tax=Ixodes persulcatus TaxID=34615 RepID=A0AC60PT00_IXOPE|nr:hypothetical protein HPB47_028503 [Ixodes persulcatus]
MIASSSAMPAEQENRGTLTRALPVSAAGGRAADKSEMGRCVFCGSNEHILEKCTSPLTIQEKKENLKAENRCFQCTKQFHRFRECRSDQKLSCARCSGRHLTVMCDPELAGARQRTSSDSTPPQFIGISSACTTSHNQVLLQTARVRARGQTETSLRSRRVELILRSHHENTEIVIEALEVPEICGEILSITDDDMINSLQGQGITLADSHRSRLP